MSAIQPVVQSVLSAAIASVLGGSVVAAWDPLPLFANSEVGVWYDPSDFSTMFQTSTGTTPVTAVGDPVGLILDKSDGLVIGSELVMAPYSVTGSGLWSGTSTSVTRNGSTTGQASLAVSGILASTKFYRITFTVADLSGDTFYMRAGSGAGTNQITANGTYSFTTIGGGSNAVLFAPWGGVAGQATITNISVKELAGNHAYQATAASRPILGRTPATGQRNLLLATDTLSTQNKTVTAVAHTLSFTGTGTVTLTGASTAGPLVGTGAGNRVSLTFTPTAGTLTLTVSGSVTFAQLELGSSATAYQKVTAAYDVTEAGVADCYNLRFDGVDDGLATAAIDFTATDEMSVFAGLRKANDVAGIVAELSTNMNSNAGAFYFVVNDGLWDWASKSRGDASESASQMAYITETGPATAVIATTHDISGDLTTLRKNGVAATSATGNKGLGNLGNYALYIGRRAGASVPLNGNIYSLTVLGRTATAAEIAAAESYVAGKTGVVLP